ncbi:MAG: hypothetical protein QXY73_04050 [Candidatus Bathyarchaeia archaeon]
MRSAIQLVFRLINEIYAQICSMGRDWIDINMVLDTLKRNYHLGDEEAEIVFNFLAKYFLEMDESGKRVRPMEEFCNLYREE